MERVKVKMEFIFRASPTILYKFVTTPACLVLWFCDSVDIQDDVYTFEWQGAEEIADMIDDIEEELVRYRWRDEDIKEYLEFKMYKTTVTNQTILEITDYCDSDEVDDTRDYWEDLMKKLKMASGG